MFLLVTDVIWEFAETFHKNHRALVSLQGPLGSRDRPTGNRVLGGQGVGLQCPRGSRGRLTGSQEVKGYA